MVIALVGKHLSHKHAIAELIQEQTDDRFALVHQYSTRKGYAELYMNPDDFDELDKSEIFFDEERHGWHYFTLRSQFIGKDVIYITDNAASVKCLDSLCEPYVVVNIDCSAADILDQCIRSNIDSSKISERIKEMAYDMIEFDKSGEYFMYIDTSKLKSAEVRQGAVCRFVSDLKEWEHSRSKEALHMRTINEILGPIWNRYSGLVFANQGED